MKILRISLSNIASLGGVHHVDFTREPLRSAGLFAISGATGAGKSSLLDALCLALYDATPRLNQVGRLADLENGEKQNDPRNLLRRGCAEAFAEVAFVGVDKQAWTAQWHVRRGHRKADGKLQNVAMTLFRGNTEPLAGGEVVAGGNKLQVKAAIEEKIGLTFPQFTRAVLLAQNDFATFLKADDNERADILRALTGTDEYDVISKNTYVRHTNEKKLVESLRAKLSGVQLMSPEEREEADQKAKDAAAELSKREAIHRLLDSSLQWFVREHALSEDVKQTKVRIENAQAEQLQLAERRKALQMTNLVSHEARALRIAQKQAQERLARAQRDHEQATANHTEIKNALSLATQSADLARKRLDEVKSSQLAAKPALKRAGELDQELASLDSRLLQAEKAVEDAARAERKAANDLAENKRQRETRNAAKDLLEKEQMQWAAYVPFVADGSKWLDRICVAISTKVAAEKDGLDLQERTREVAEALASCERARGDEPRLKDAWDSAAKAFSAALDRVEEFDEDQLNADLLRCDETERVLCRLKDQLVTRQADQAKTVKLNVEMEADQQLQADDKQALQQLETQSLPRAIQDVEIAKRQLSVMQAAVDDAAKRLREELKQDCECPVCGSLEHPYRIKQPDLEVAAISAARKSLDELETERDRVQGEVHRLKITIVAREKQLDDKRRELSELMNQIQERTFESCDHAEVKAMLSLPEESQIDAATERIASIKVEKDSIKNRLGELAVAKKQLENCRKALEGARDAHAKLTDSLVALEREYDKRFVMKVNAETSLSKSEAQCQDAIIGLADLWEGLPMAKANFESDCLGFQQSLGDALYECRRIDSQLKELSTEISNLDSVIKPLQQSAEREQQALAACRKERDGLSKDKATRVEERSKLFEGKAVSIVEVEMAKLLEAAIKADQEATENQNQQNSLLATAIAHLNSAEQSQKDTTVALTVANADMSKWREQFQAKMLCSVEMAEIDVMLARNEEWITSEQTAIQKVDDAVKNAKSELSVHESQLQRHREKRPTNDSREAIEAAIAESTSELEVAKKAEQEAKAKIISDDACHKAHGETTNQLKEQEQIAAPWAKLSDLIGSADGALFRKIAQRRTLDVLLEYANHQLNLLAARYRLLRLPESLNLIVLDRDMADERRSIHSLSGGESFLVSLALALGLASLTSNRLRIESLFIDEGFGSLDPETLNTAMSALMHLEAQGRKVGVISHVTEMTDAIPVQIKIVKGRGGVSKMVVPGLVTG
jgi:exonuclease SbcC